MRYLTTHVAVARLDVDVRGAAFERVEHHRVDQLDYRRHLLVARQPVHVQDLFALLGLAHERERVRAEAGGRVLEYARGGVAPLERFFDGRLGRDRGLQPQVQLRLDLVDHVEVRRVGHRHMERVAFPLERDEVVPDHQINRQLVDQMVVDLFRLRGRRIEAGSGAPSRARGSLPGSSPAAAL